MTESEKLLRTCPKQDFQKKVKVAGYPGCAKAHFLR